MSAIATLDATDLPELRHIAERIRERREPLVIRVDGQDIAIITPVPPSDADSVGVLTRDEFETMMSAAGGWRDIVDTDLLKEELRRARGQAPRPWDL